MRCCLPRSRFSALVALCGAIVCAARASPAAAQAVDGSPATRPHVALVLAGGGAKGAAHIGVLRVLDELHIPVDCVVGTSMGALVGAVYASGIPPPDIESAVLEVDWGRVVGGQGRRDRMPIQRKLTAATYTNSFEVGVRKRQLLMPGGLVGAQEIEQVIRALVARARQTSDFDQLPIPFRAVATDMLHGEMVVLANGDLSQAMRASMALPGVFAPVERDGRILSDGGMMRNLPVDIGRTLCGDAVIAVWMSSPPPKPESLESALSLVTRSLDVMIGANERAQIESLTPRDVGIEVPMGTMGTGDFERVPEAIALGRAAAEMRREELLKFAVPEDEYRAWAQSLGRASAAETALADVRIVGADRVEPEYVRAQLENVAPGASVSTTEIAADVERVYALGDFERVEYALTGPEDARVLEIAPVEKPWGPNFFRADLGLAAYEAGDMFAILRADHDRTWVNSRGGRWHNALQLGRQSIATTDFYQPIDVRQRFFVQPIVLFQENREDVYLDGDRVARYDVREAYGHVDFGANFGTRAQVRLGFRRGSYDATIDTGIPALPEIDRTNDASMQWRVSYDTRDSVALPTHGSFMAARYVRSGDWLGGDEHYSVIESVFTKAMQVRGGDSLNLVLGGANEIDGDLPITQQIELGGIRTFPGLRPGELRGDSYWFAGTEYGWRVAELSPLSGRAIYAGLRFQAGEMRDRIDGTPEEVLYGISGSLGGRTPLGPFLLSLGYVDNGSWQLQFTLGRPVAEGSLLDAIQ
ncbi:MAG TPA: patatin-like phospholipase family protein [Gammaproteobacteria bacterium]|nr:patatin-like phospholipase family protein [Gammaproteobacteria bacterium]